MIFIQTDKSTWAVPPALNMRDPSALNATASTDPFILRLSTHCFVWKDEANRKIINIYVSPGLKRHGIALTVIFFKTTKLQSNVKTIVIIRKNVEKMAKQICIFCSFVLLTGTKSWNIKMPSRFDGASFITWSIKNLWKDLKKGRWASWSWWWSRWSQMVTNFLQMWQNRCISRILIRQTVKRSSSLQENEHHDLQVIKWKERRGQTGSMSGTTLKMNDETLADLTEELQTNSKSEKGV